jgi:hypothetical protein
MNKIPCESLQGDFSDITLTVIPNGDILIVIIRLINFGNNNVPFRKPV